MSTEKGARRARFVKGTVSTRAVKLDETSESPLRTICQIIDGPSPDPVDQVSFKWSAGLPSEPMRHLSSPYATTRTKSSRSVMR